MSLSDQGKLTVVDGYLCASVVVQQRGVTTASALFTLGELREALSRAGLALVPAADVPTPEEREVLKECEKLSESELLAMTSDDYYAPEYAHDLGQAIIAWKAAKEAK